MRNFKTIFSIIKIIYIYICTYNRQIFDITLFIITPSWTKAVGPNPKKEGKVILLFEEGDRLAQLDNGPSFVELLVIKQNQAVEDALPCFIAIPF